MKEVLKVLRDLRIETSDRNNYSQSYAFGYTDAISDAIQAVKKMNYIPCCKSDSKQLCDKYVIPKRDTNTNPYISRKLGNSDM